MMHKINTSQLWRRPLSKWSSRIVPVSQFQLY